MVEEINPSLDQIGWLNKIANPILKKFSERHAEVAVEMRSGFYKYCQRTRERCGIVKTIMSRGERVNIEDFYVSPLVNLGRSNLTHEQLTKRLERTKRVVITGTAGLGKSIYLKYLVMFYTFNSNRPMPIFFELRELNEKNISIEDALFEMVNTPKCFLSRQQFSYALEQGIIAIFLDAFDEIDNDRRARYEKETISFSMRFPDMQIILTSRPSPEEEIEGWGPFEHATLQPFDLERVVDLISKTKEDDSEKERFIKVLRQQLFATHQSFLSTPLLALIMFLTFQTGAQIPDKLYEFYHRAFEALYYRHDTQKGHYTRKSYTDLSRDNFVRLITAICAITYFDGQISPHENEFKKRIEAAKDLEKIEVDTNNVLKDFIESVCLLQRDGLNITFTHRSFQEYFTATFILNSDVLDTFAIINQLISRQGFDNVVKMIGEMNREFIEKKWILRWLDLYLEKVKDIDCNKDLAKYLRFLRYDINIYYTNDGLSFGFTGKNENSGAVGTILHHLYHDEFRNSEFFYIIDEVKAKKNFQDIDKYYMLRDKVPYPRKK